MEAKIEKVDVIISCNFGAHDVLNVQVFILRVPLGPDRFWSSQSAFPERNSLLVR